LRSRRHASAGLRFCLRPAYLDPEQAAALRELSAKSGKPMQSYLREGVDLVLAKHGKARK
jgi:hypothetical protein